MEQTALEVIRTVEAEVEAELKQCQEEAQGYVQEAKVKAEKLVAEARAEAEAEAEKILAEILQETEAEIAKLKAEDLGGAVTQAAQGQLPEAVAYIIKAIGERARWH